MGGPCTAWANVNDAAALPDLKDADPAFLALALSASCKVLYALSARQFPGVCLASVRPHRRYVEDATPSSPWWWRAWGSYGHPGGCGCSMPPRITLGYRPIRQVTEVRIDGEVLDPAAYRIDNRRELTRIDGEGWPLCQDLTADPDTDADTFRVTFRWGTAPGDDGVLANLELASELVKAKTAPEESRLPERITSLVTQGESLAMLDPWQFLDKGKTGLYWCDIFLSAANPHRLTRRSAVFSPDIAPPVQRTATTPDS